MILQALTDYYRVLEQAGKIDAPGWAPVKVSYALLLSENGTLEQVIDIQTEQPRGKKMVSAPQILSLPRACETNGGSGRQLPLRQRRLSAGDRQQGQAPADPRVL